ncbi:MAG: protein-glutamate O-methyltransferase CheR [Gammaproteobacteria bacterium]
MTLPVAEPRALREREFDFSSDEFEALRKLVKQHTGIHLSEQKRELVYGRLSRRLRALGMQDFREYRALLAAKDSQELVEFCNAITTNLTSFFRESHHFDYVRDQLLAARAADPMTSRRMRFWCAGCSTGEEPYSLAMSVHEAIRDVSRWDIRILATDLDTDVLAKCRRGVYGEDRLRDMNARRRATFFNPQGEGAAASYSVTPQLRDMISFTQLNLMDALPMRGPLDAIFCRNVVIYFDKDTQRALFARMAALQRPGALLFLGHSESLFKVSDAYALVGKTIYRRI